MPTTTTDSVTGLEATTEHWADAIEILWKQNGVDFGSQQFSAVSTK